MKIRPCLTSFTRKAYAKHGLEAERGELLDCSLGVNRFGASEKVLEAATTYDWSRVWLCPDPSYDALKRRIVEFWADHADIQMDQVQIGHGSMEVLERVNRIFLETGSKVLGFSPQFTGYVADIGASGACYDPVILRSEEGFTFYVERLLEKLSPEYSLIYVDNPNNPTGQLINLNEIELLVREAEHRDVALIVDEAYGDYFEQRYSAINLINKYNNLMVTRTFGKGLGLCSLKIGYGILPLELSHYFSQVAPPFRATTIGSYLAAVALSDQDFIAGCRQLVRTEKEKLITGLRERGFFSSKTYEYCPIFLLGHENEDVDLKQQLLSKGILTVPGTDFEHLGKNYVRMNCPASADDFLRRL
jgi:histidinol-phosphate aminotransferase